MQIQGSDIVTLFGIIAVVTAVFNDVMFMWFVGVLFIVAGLLGRFTKSHND